MFTIKKPYRWYHGLAFYVAAQVVALGLGRLVSAVREEAPDTNEEQREFYREQELPIIAPPSWAFAPAWTINNLLAIWGTLHVLNQPKGTAGRKTYVALQAASWVDYVLFNAGYFSLQSTLNAAALTGIYLVLTLASLGVALFRLRDGKVVASLSTLILWLSIATPTAFLQALWNRDEFYDVGPFAEPRSDWVK